LIGTTEGSPQTGQNFGSMRNTLLRLAQIACERHHRIS
jgi:hypothetical protein